MPSAMKPMRPRLHQCRPVERVGLDLAGDPVIGLAIDALEDKRIARGEKYRLLATLVEHPKRRAADEVPTAGTLEWIDSSPVHGDGDRGARHSHAWFRASRQYQRRIETHDVGEARHETQVVDRKLRLEVACDDLLNRFASAFCDFLEVGRKVRIVVAAGNGHIAARAFRHKSMLDHGFDGGLECRPCRDKRIVRHHQRPHGGNRFHQAGKLARGLRAADCGVQRDHPAVDVGRDLVGEFDGEGGVAAGQVPNPDIGRGLA
jgi:hypothetical protein